MKEEKLQRIFVALPIIDLQNKILEFQKKWKHLPVRWVSPSNLHITLVPPWYEKETDVEKVKRQLYFLDSQFPAFKINFNLISYGPNKNFPRLIWAVGQAPPQLLKLREAIFNALGQTPPSGEFLLHLTLARFAPVSLKKLQKLEVEVDWEENVSEFVLMESHLLASGAEYEILYRFKLV